MNMFTIMVLVGFKDGVEFQFPWQKQLSLPSRATEKQIKGLELEF